MGILGVHSVSYFYVSIDSAMVPRDIPKASKRTSLIGDDELLEEKNNKDLILLMVLRACDSWRYEQKRMSDPAYRRFQEQEKSGYRRCQILWPRGVVLLL